MLKVSEIASFLLVSMLFILLTGPMQMTVHATEIDVSDGTLTDWDSAPVKLYDPVDTPPSSYKMTDLSFVSFDYDDTWLYVRWDIYNNSLSPAVLYDMGINLSASSSPVWDIFVSAQIEDIGGVPVLTNISIRDAADVHVWNATDNGNMSEDGTLHIDPPLGGSPGNHSVEARFPLQSLGIVSGMIYGQFRSHSSPSVNSAVKDRIPANESEFIVITIDNFPPELSNLNDAPDPQENGEAVNITLDVTDDIGVETVWVHITYPDLSWTNNSMLKGSGDTWHFETTYDILGSYSYIVYANDTNNWNETGPETFFIQDTDGPWLYNLADTPDPQENGGFVHISLDVNDDVGVADVRLNITFPDSTWINISMQQGVGDIWFYNTTYDDLGEYTYKVYALDTSGNSETAGPSTFSIQDSEAPEVLDIVANPDPQENDGFVNITVDIIDDVGVDEVWVNITYPDGTWINVSMDNGTQDSWFINQTFTEPGNYSYTVWAKDSSGNWVKSETRYFVIEDTDGPKFSNLAHSPDPQEEDGNVNITVDVFDDIGLESVKINITSPDGTWYNYSMVPGEGNQWIFNGTFHDSGNYTYTIWAVDDSGNWNSTGPGEITITAVEPPDDEDEKKGRRWIFLLIFWPLFLMLFSAILVHRYGSGRKFQRELARMINEAPSLSPKDILTFAVSKGMPPEVIIHAALGGSGEPASRDYLNDIVEAIKDFKRK